MNNRYYTVCGIVEIDGKVLLVRHTYGTAKDRILLPGGYVRENELPTAAAERELFEETSVRAKVQSVMSVQFKPNQWCVVFIMRYLSGTPQSDNGENSEVLLLAPEEAIGRSDITNMSRELLKMYCSEEYSTLRKSVYIPQTSTADDYVIFGV